VLCQSLNLTPPVVIEWDIKLSLYQSVVVTFISSFNKVGEGVTNQYDRVLVNRVAFLEFISNSKKEVSGKSEEILSQWSIYVARGSFVSGPGGEIQVKKRS
jgi:hypothetical protein